jgi:integrase
LSNFNFPGPNVSTPAPRTGSSPRFRRQGSLRYGSTPRCSDSFVLLQSGGITKQVGWHTFRHSLATLLVKKREGIKVVQELMRRADSRTTLDIYSQSDDEDKWADQKPVSGLFRACS